MAIEFYVKGQAYGEFSNFSPHGVEMEGYWYPTVEHYFQAMKFAGHDHAETIRLAANPKLAKQFGQSRDIAMRSDWEDVKADVMRAAVRKKFATHSQLKALLLSTGGEQLIEAAPADYFWGCGKTGTGLNWLGRILMEVREELRKCNESLRSPTP